MNFLFDRMTLRNCGQSDYAEPPRSCATRQCSTRILLSGKHSSSPSANMWRTDQVEDNPTHTDTNARCLALSIYPGRIVLLRQTHTWSRLLVYSILIPSLLCGRYCYFHLFSFIFYFLKFTVTKITWIKNDLDLISLILCCHPIVTRVTEAELRAIKMSSKSFPHL